MAAQDAQMRYEVDFVDSVFPTEIKRWEVMAPDVLQELRALARGAREAPVCILSLPSGQDLVGVTFIVRHGQGLAASGDLTMLLPDVDALAARAGLPAEGPQRERFKKSIPLNSRGEPAVVVGCDVVATTPEELLNRFAERARALAFSCSLVSLRLGLGLSH